MKTWLEAHPTYYVTDEMDEKVDPPREEIVADELDDWKSPETMQLPRKENLNARVKKNVKKMKEPEMIKILM